MIEILFKSRLVYQMKINYQEKTKYIFLQFHWAHNPKRFSPSNVAFLILAVCPST